MQGLKAIKECLYGKQVWTCLLSGMLVVGMACRPRSEPARIAVAANLTQVMQEVVEAFEAQGGPAIEMSTAASGVLAAQIQHGAPFHAFLSANAMYPERLEQHGLIQAPPRSLAAGQLVLWSRFPLNGAVEEVLANSDAIRLAIANPELAPYGTAAAQWLDEQGLQETWKGRLVFGENVGQVNQYIRSQSVELAITAYSASRSAELAQYGYWSAPLQGTELHLPQVWVRLHGAPPEIMELETFLASETVREIFRRYGYLPGQIAMGGP